VILFFVADHRLNRAPPFEMLFQCPSGFVLTGDVNFDVFRMMFFAAVATIYKCFFGSDAGQPFGLIDRGFERRSVVRIAVMRLDADDPIAF
jgi:hypothetical protein